MDNEPELTIAAQIVNVFSCAYNALSLVESVLLFFVRLSAQPAIKPARATIAAVSALSRFCPKEPK